MRAPRVHGHVMMLPLEFFSVLDDSGMPVAALVVLLVRIAIIIIMALGESFDRIGLAYPLCIYIYIYIYIF